MTGAYAYWQGDCCQSEIDENGVSLAPYIHAIYDLIRQSKAQKILIIGCAGGTLATLLKRAGHEVTIVDIEPKSFEIAERYFKLPPGVNCKVDDGLKFLQNTNQQFSAIVLDAFANGTIPQHLRSSDFFASARSRLSDPGHFYLNIILEDDFDPSANQIAKFLSENHLQVGILDTRGPTGRNAVVVAGQQINFALPKITVSPAVMRQTLRNELEKMQFYSWRTLTGSQLSSTGLLHYNFVFQS